MCCRRLWSQTERQQYLSDQMVLYSHIKSCGSESNFNKIFVLLRVTNTSNICMVYQHNVKNTKKNDTFIWSTHVPNSSRITSFLPPQVQSFRCAFCAGFRSDIKCVRALGDFEYRNPHAFIITCKCQCTFYTVTFLEGPFISERKKT